MDFNLKGKITAVIFLTSASVLSAAPRLGVSATTLGPINVAPGANGTARIIEAFNLGDGTLNLSASGSASWLTASVGSLTACTTRTGSCYPVSIALNTASLGPGTYTEYLNLSDPNAVDSPQTVAVTVNTTGVPASINAYVTPYGGMTSNAIFPVYTSGSGLKATVTTQSGGNWLQFLSGSSGIITYPAPWLIEAAALSGQAPGTYTGTVVVSGSSVPSDNKTINVTLNVTASPIVALNNSSNIRLTSYQGGGKQYSFVTFNNLGQGTLTVTGATASANFLSASVSTPNSVLITADPAGLAPGIYNGSVTIASNAANNSQVSVPVEFVVAAAGQPSIFQGGIVNAANGAQEAVSQGDIASIYGNQLAPAGTSATNASTPLATTLGGTQVLVNGVPAPLYFVSPGQINFQIPYGLTAGQLATVQVVSNSATGNTRSVSINSTSPRLLFFQSFIQGTYGVIVNTDGSLTLPSGTSVPGFQTHPAKPGDVLTLYGVGFGQTTPPVVEGQASPSKAPLAAISGVSAIFGGGFYGRATSSSAAFAGLTPTAVGLYQINVVVPPDSPLGAAVPITAIVNGVPSNVVYVAVSASGQ